MDTTDVIVGVDGSAPSRAALRWAVAEASRRHAALRVLCAYGARASDEAMREQAEAVVDEAVAEAGTVAPGIAVEGAAVHGHAAAVLLDAARHAALLVVGSRGHGGLAGLLVGSVSQQVAMHAPGPVVVVRGRADTAAGPVVVGVDGSSSGDGAVRLAFEQAAARGCALVTLFAYPTPLPPRGIDVPPLLVDPDKLGTDLDRKFTEMVSGWRDKHPEVTVERAVVPGSPGHVLVDASHEAQLVVVGNRGHGGFTGLLLGSVGLHLLHHADCPVLIVRDDVS